MQVGDPRPVEAFERLVPAAEKDERALPALEAAMEVLYATASHDPRRASPDVEAALGRHAARLPAIAAWHALLGLRRARRAAWPDALQTLDDALARAPSRTRWLASVEAARLVRRCSGVAEAWARVRDLAPVLREDAWREGPMAVSAALGWLELAGGAGEWGRHDEVAGIAATAWPEGSPPAIRVGLLLASHAIQRGRLREAIDRTIALEPAARGDLRGLLLCTRLRALAALGEGGRPEARRTYRLIRRVRRERSDPEHRLTRGERRALRRQADGIARQAGIASAARGGGGSVVARLAGLERKARGMRRDAEGKVRLMFRILDRADAALCRPDPVTDVEAWLRLRLLRCRVLFDLAVHEAFPECAEELGRIHEEAARRGLAPLAMQALDQRALVRARSPAADWVGAVDDASRAAAIAVRVLAANAGPAGHDGGRSVERALLSDLLPVFDRVLDLHTDGALRMAARHPSLLADPIRSYPEARDADTPEGSWVRFGRVVHAYAEQTQALALEEARRAYAGGATSPPRLAIAAEGPARVVVDEIAAALPPRDAVLQYFVFGRVVLVFVIGRDVFDWHAAAAPGADLREGPARAHDALTRLVDGLRAFTRGEPRPEERAGVVALHDALLPAKIQAAIAGADPRHLRIVPHDVLYRVPFGKLSLAGSPLAQRFSLSLHPTGRLAAAAAPERPATGAGASIGHVIGPGVGCAEEDARAVRRGAGSIAPLGSVSRIDTAAEGLAALRDRAGAHDILHFTCHGTEGDALSRPVLRLGGAGEAALDLAGAAALRLRPRALLVLEACWTGWMDHERRNPVHGFPQAFCDAGAGAVIAPLVPLPEALAPFFSDAFYRALRFLPAEQALHRALAVLRAHGHAICAGSPEAIAKLREHGSMDAFEYRYTGAPGIRFGGRIARIVGRLAFRFWLARLALRARGQASPAISPGEAAGGGRPGSG